MGIGRRAAPWLLLGVLSCSDRPLGGGGGDGGDGGDSLARVCRDGCTHFETCLPGAFAELYASELECLDACLALAEGAACEAEAVPYYECTIERSCTELADLVMDPTKSACADEFSGFQTACDP